MKLQLGVFAAALVAILFTLPGVRQPLFDALPDLGDDDPNCGKIVCSGQRQSSSKDAPDMKFRPY